MLTTKFIYKTDLMLRLVITPIEALYWSFEFDELVLEKIM
jgi:hypothetical protein